MKYLVLFNQYSYINVREDDGYWESHREPIPTYKLFDSLKGVKRFISDPDFENTYFTCLKFDPVEIENEQD